MSRIAAVAGALLTVATASLLMAVPAAPQTTGGVAADASPSSPSGAVSGTLAVRRILFAGPRPQRLTFAVPGTGEADVAVDLVRAGTVSPVRSWTLGTVPRGVEQVVTWDGADEAGGRGASDGTYRFRVAVDGAPPAPVATTFTFVRAFFPVRGPHSFGDGIGAGRGHQGVDVLAGCGTPLLAARGGRVERAGFHGAAGNMVAIDVVGSPSDMVYMHLDGPPLVAVGDDVTTGQRIGGVGTTGRSTACHLHFELWSGPGYLTGGRPVDPARQLRLWNAQTGGDREARRR